MEKSKFLEVAKIINTHGVSGELKLEYTCDSPEILKKIKTLYIGGEKYAVVSARVAGGGRFVLAKLDGVDDLDKAMRFKGKIALADRDAVPKKDGAHFICDIIGLDVIDAVSGVKYGVLDDVQRPAVQEIYYVKTDGGRIVMLPNVKEFVKEIDEEKGVFITPIKGFFDEEDDDEI